MGGLYDQFLFQEHAIQSCLRGLVLISNFCPNSLSQILISVYCLDANRARQYDARAIKDGRGNDLFSFLQNTTD